MSTGVWPTARAARGGGDDGSGRSRQERARPAAVPVPGAPTGRHALAAGRRARGRRVPGGGYRAGYEVRARCT